MSVGFKPTNEELTTEGFMGLIYTLQLVSNFSPVIVISVALLLKPAFGKTEFITGGTAKIVFLLYKIKINKNININFFLYILLPLFIIMIQS